MNTTQQESATGVSLVVLAAGLGRRFGGGKQMAGIDPLGRPLMYYSICDAFRAGVRHVVLIVSAELEATVRQDFIPQLPPGLEVELAIQCGATLPDDCPLAARAKPWGTAHALWCARHCLHQPFLVINADDYYGEDALSLLVEHFQTSAEWAIACYALRRTLSDYGGVNRGLCRIEHGYLTSIAECFDIQRDHSGLRGTLHGESLALDRDQPVSMNLWGFTPAVFARLEAGLRAFAQQYGQDPVRECLLPEQVLAAIAGGQRVRAYHTGSQWRGITYPQDLEKVADHFHRQHREPG